LLAKTPRIAAAAIALVGWFALAVQFRATFGQTGSVAETLWILLRYFTVLTNVLVAVVLTGIVLGRPRFAAPAILGFVTFAIMLVGVVYMTLLRGLLELSGGALLADAFAYFAYALARGSIEGRYAYPFIDLGALGAAQVALNAALIAAAFLVAGMAVVWLDGALARRTARR
jgi:predicted nucleic acid-binding protein